MKTHKIPLLLALTALGAGSAGAVAVIYEPFDYADTGPLDNTKFFGDGTQSGALGLDGAWSGLNSSGLQEFEVNSSGLTFTDGGANVLPTAGGYVHRPQRTGTSAASSAVSASATLALTADNTTMWMSFLYVDEGFSGPTSAIVLASETIVNGDSSPLSTAGYGVGVAIRATSNPNRAPHTAYFNGSTNFTTNAAADKFLSSGGPENTVFLYALKVNWKEDGTPDEMYLFEVDDLTTEPLEGTAIVSDTFDMLLVNQLSLDVLNIAEAQADGFDEVRFGATFNDVGGIVPEPSSLALLGLGGLGLILRRRR